MAEAEIKCKVHKHFGVIDPAFNSGWGRLGSFELNLVSWNGSAPLFDLRCWSDNVEHPVSKGVRFSLENAKELYKILGKAIEEMEKPPEEKKPETILIKKSKEKSSK